MNTFNSRFEELLHLYLQNNLELKDYEEFFRLLSGLPEEELTNLFSQPTTQDDNLNEMDSFINERVALLQRSIQQTIAENSEKQETPVQSIKKINWGRWISVAASIVFVFGIISYQFYWKNEDPMVEEVVMKKIDVSPGRDAAVMLIDGKEIVLDGEKSGVVLSDSAFTYLDGSDPTKLHAQEIQLITPRAGQYQMVLSDGTKVWMNAASRLIVASDFNIKNRNVQLTGEAYFEVKKNKDLPFIIHSKRQDIKVLGTSFNVNAYEDEPFAKTTLVSGSLNVNNQILKPNQQAILNQKNKQIETFNVDANLASSWKDGVLNLSGLSFDECMRIIGRWYDLDIQYEGAIPKIELAGKMSRGVKLSTFLDFLNQNTGVKAEIQANRKLIIK
ncbi:DUF4974 domain-containing protein [Sphingobacterium sp. DK4209]|uniref:DUF4974 domain-containing protein n=1 Tax=Sphingobacterium zhuxiongii TaxID=2662364 RepID=A0A5Q0Q9T5_9SPHI|nr:FecR family protein [Sphingobacterium sp. DK4209]MVZ67062.1 DUF4974 domain-containing protein [Sphingobacterium sp. DK4209]QGA26867.1 DUF4974 domain-containing protein [Sphingobacterium sp. dk4302]